MWAFQTLHDSQDRKMKSNLNSFCYVLLILTNRNFSAQLGIKKKSTSPFLHLSFAHVTTCRLIIGFLNKLETTAIINFILNSCATLVFCLKSKLFIYYFTSTIFKF